MGKLLCVAVDAFNVVHFDHKVKHFPLAPAPLGLFAPPRPAVVTPSFRVVQLIVAAGMPVALDAALTPPCSASSPRSSSRVRSRWDLSCQGRVSQARTRHSSTP